VVNVVGKKQKKPKREKVWFGQAPRNALPEGPEETLAAGSDQGAGATSGVLPAPGAAMASIDTTPTLPADVDPLGPHVVSHGKTRYSDRAATEGATKAAAKAVKVQQKVAEAPTPMTADEKLAQKLQDAPLGPGVDNSKKKKKKRVKGAPKERLQDQPPAPPAPKPDMTPIPPKSVRDNGEPAVLPAPATPPVTGPVDAPPTAPATTATPPAAQH
jgi:peptidyl-prolyl cis-trans isomerase SurA